MADLETGELRLNGEAINIQRKPFELLAALLAKPGQVVLRDELYQRLWPGVSADYRRGLDTAVKKLRRALGDSETEPEYIETLARRGYRLIAPVTAIAEEDSSPALPGYPSPPTPLAPNSEANRLYLQGYHCWHKRTAESLRTALAFFHQARESDPDSDIIHAAIAGTYVMLTTHSTLCPRTAVTEARAAAWRALELNPSQLVARLVLAWTRGAFDYDLRGARTDLEALLEIAPEHPWLITRFSMLLTTCGDHDAAIRNIDKAHRIDPVSPSIYALRGRVRYFARNFDTAVRMGADAVARDPEFGLARFYYAQELLAVNQAEAAIQHLRTASELMAGSSEVRATLGVALAGTGEITAARDIDHELEQQSRDCYIDAYHRGLLKLALDDRDGAADLIGQSQAQGSSWFALAAVDPKLDPLRDEPRVQQLVKPLDC